MYDFDLTKENYYHKNQQENKIPMEKPKITKQNKHILLTDNEKLQITEELIRMGRIFKINAFSIYDTCSVGIKTTKINT